MKTILSTIICCAITLFWGESIHARVLLQDITYSGKIGKINITMRIGVPDANGVVYGHYFYNSQCLDIPMEGTRKAGVLTLYAGSFLREENEKERFDLKVSGKTIKGTWTHKGKKMAVTLTQSVYDSKSNPYANNPFFKEQDLNDDYERIRISKAVLTPIDSVEMLKSGITIQWHKEQHWNSYVFRVTKGLPEATMKWVNDYLEFQQIMDFAYRGMCSYGEESEYDCTVRDLFINQDFLAFNHFVGYYCGGAHPDFSSSQHNLDLKNQKILTTEDLVQFAENIPEASDFDAWSLYRSEVFCPTVMDMLKQEHPSEMEPTDTDDGESCDYNDPNVWQFSSALITEDGIWFSAYFYRFARSCDDPDWSVISYERLSENLNPVYKNILLSIGK